MIEKFLSIQDTIAISVLFATLVGSLIKIYQFKYIGR